MTTSLYNLKLAALLWATEHSARPLCFIVLKTCIVSGAPGTITALAIQNQSKCIYTEYNQKHLVFWLRKYTLRIWTRRSVGMNYESGGQLIADPGRIRIQILPGYFCGHWKRYGSRSFDYWLLKNQLEIIIKTGNFFSVVFDSLA
jgi:hypothetical protein